MTTKQFSTIKLPQPQHSLEIGTLDLRDDSCLVKWIPRFSDIAQVVEVGRTGLALNADKFVGLSHLLIDNARPELFLRRDFIEKFVLTGRIHLIQDDRNSDSRLTSYQISTSRDNILSIEMTEKQYRRFGLVAKKVSTNKATGCKRYRIDVDLKDERIRKSNKFQDKLVQTFRRLSPINKLYFRFVPSVVRHENSSNIEATISNLDVSNDKCLEYFRYVIDEYANDGFQPVPLTGCSMVFQKLDRKWLNCSQLHPPMDFLKRIQEQPIEEVQQNLESLTRVVDLIDWLGYQLLSLDCDREEIRSKYQLSLDDDYVINYGGSIGSVGDDLDNIDTNRGGGGGGVGGGAARRRADRLDVACAQLSGILDFEQIQDCLKMGKLFKLDNDDCNDDEGGVSSDDCVILRALILYQTEQQQQLDNSNSNYQPHHKSVILLQDCAQVFDSESNRSNSNLITIIGMSSRT